LKVLESFFKTGHAGPRCHTCINFLIAVFPILSIVCQTLVYTARPLMWD